MSRVVVVGSVNLDLSVAVPHLPAPGETVLGSEVAFRPGGKGGNQAVAAQRLGAQAVLFAAVGDDTFGADLRRSLAAEGVELANLTTVRDAATGLAMIVVEPAGENTIVVAAGANALLSDVELSLSADCVLLLQLEIPLSTCVEAAVQARQAGATVVLNAAPLPKQPGKELQRLLSNVDILVVNEGEATQLFGSTEPSWGSVAAHGLRACVVTLGSRGAIAVTAEGVHRQEAFRVDAVDTTGAGDSFCGALAVSLADGLALTEAVRRGCAGGALAATKPGAQSALPTATELEKFLRGAK
ncbi:MAG TPA: ribokinase [Candidatus Limnocylindrales bacterium]